MAEYINICSLHFHHCRINMNELSDCKWSRSILSTALYNADINIYFNGNCICIIIKKNGLYVQRYNRTHSFEPLKCLLKIASIQHVHSAVSTLIDHRTQKCHCIIVLLIISYLSDCTRV